MRKWMLAFVIYALISPVQNAAADPDSDDLTGRRVADSESPGVRRHQGSQPYSDPSDGGAFRCDKSVVAGGISVRPSSIVIADGIWSLLVKTEDLDAAERVKLRIGSADHPPLLVVRTTDSTAVLTFRYQAAGSDTAAFVLFPDGEMRRLISLDAHGLTPGGYYENRIRVKARLDRQRLLIDEVRAWYTEHGFTIVQYNESSYSCYDFTSRHAVFCSGINAIVTEIIGTGRVTNRSVLPGFFCQKLGRPIFKMEDLPTRRGHIRGSLARPLKRRHRVAPPAAGLRVFSQTPGRPVAPDVAGGALVDGA